MHTILAIGFPGPLEMAVLGLAVLLLFGTRLPSVMRSLGVGITEFKKGINGEIDADGQPSEEASIEEQDKSDSKDSQTSSHSTSV